MTPSDRLETDLPSVLEHLYLGARPAYADDALRLAVAEPRRRAGFLGRLLRPAHAHANSRPEQRHPWRTVLLVGAISCCWLRPPSPSVADRDPRCLPPATAIAYDHDGDIYVGDPVTGGTSAIVTGPDQDRGPVFSPDGALIAFVRRHPVTVEDTGSAQMPAGWQPVGASDIVVVRADGSDAHVITPQRQVALESVSWAPDAGSVEALVMDASTSEGVRREMAFDVTGRSEPHPVEPPFGIAAPNTIVSPRVTVCSSSAIGRRRALDGGLRDAPSWLRSSPSAMPPAALSTSSWIEPGWPVWICRPMTSLRSKHSPSLAWAGWSPDGSTIDLHVRVDYEARSQFQDAAPPESWVFVMNADGSDLRRVTDDVGPTETDAFITEGSLLWSPDASRIAVDRRVTTEGGEEQCCTVIVTDVSGVRRLAIDVGTTGYSAPNWDSLSWAPDGRSLLFYDYQRAKLVIVDAETGAPTELPWQVGYDPDWQRLPRP
jgi:hypothetical protein